jgi:hypothetical protein
MSGAREYDPVRTTTAAESVPGERVVPAGAEGAVPGARPDGSCLAEAARTPQTADGGLRCPTIPGQGSISLRHSTPPAC